MNVSGKATFPYGEFAKKLEEFNISKKQAGELSHHLLEIDMFVSGFKPHIEKIIKCKKSEKDDFKELLEDLWGELEHHIIENHMIPAKKILNKITNRL